MSEFNFPFHLLLYLALLLPQEIDPGWATVVQCQYLLYCTCFSFYCIENSFELNHDALLHCICLFNRKRPNFDKELSISDHTLRNSSTVETAHSRSSSSASSTSQQSVGNTPHRGGSLPRTKPKKYYGDITPTRKLSRQTASDVDVHIQNESSPFKHQAVRKYLSDDAGWQTLPRKMKINATKSDGGPIKTSRPSSANSNTSADDHTLAEEHNKMIFEAKALTECLLDLQKMVGFTASFWFIELEREELDKGMLFGSEGK